MPMDDTAFGLARDRLTRVAPGQPRRFAIAGKSGEKAMYMRIAQSAAQPMSQVEQPFKSGFQWRVVGLVHKLQGKYVFMEEASYGSVSEGKIIRAISQQLKNGGELWGGNDKKISNLAAVFMPKAQAATLAETLDTPDEDNSYDEAKTPEPAKVDVVPVEDPFEDYLQGFGDIQAKVFEAAEDFQDAIKKLKGVLESSGDDFLKDVVAAKHLPPYLNFKELDAVLQSSANVLVSDSEKTARVKALNAVVAAVKSLLDVMDKKKTELDAMQLHQPPEGAPVPVSGLRGRTEELSLVCQTIVNDADTWAATPSSSTSGTT